MITLQTRIADNKRRWTFEMDEVDVAILWAHVSVGLANEIERRTGCDGVAFMASIGGLASREYETACGVLDELEKRLGPQPFFRLVAQEFASKRAPLATIQAFESALGLSRDQYNP